MVDGIFQLSWCHYKKCMKYDFGYGCGFHSPKNTKMLFSLKISHFEISIFIKYIILN